MLSEIIASSLELNSYWVGFRIQSVLLTPSLRTAAKFMQFHKQYLIFFVQRQQLRD